MKKYLIVVALSAFTLTAAKAVFAIAPEELSEAEVRDLMKLSSQIGQQQRSLASLKSKLASTTTVLLVVLAGSVGFVLYTVKLMGHRNREHVHQQLHNYHHAHHGDITFDKGYVHHHHHHSESS